MNNFWQLCNRKNTGFILLCIAVIYVHFFTTNFGEDYYYKLNEKEEEEINDDCRGLCRQFEDLYITLTETNVNGTL